MLLQKMTFTNAGTLLHVVPKYFIGSNNEVELSEFIGRRLSLRFSGRIFCVACGKAIKKTFGQGFCYPCFISVPETEECVLRPELCRAHEGIARDLNYAENHCLINHVVYLANSGGLKVGVTRYHQVPIRWVDQGATSAIKVLETKNRYSAGVIEVALKTVFADKTNWRKMLQGIDEKIDLLEMKKKALHQLEHTSIEFYGASDEVYSIDFTVTKYPPKVNSLTFDKVPEISGILDGIKGQYLLFDGGNAINIRSHAGYEVSLNLKDL